MDTILSVDDDDVVGLNGLNYEILSNDDSKLILSYFNSLNIILPYETFSNSNCNSAVGEVDVGGVGVIDSCVAVPYGTKHFLFYFNLSNFTNSTFTFTSNSSLFLPSCFLLQLNHNNLLSSIVLKLSLDFPPHLSFLLGSVFLSFFTPLYPLSPLSPILFTNEKNTGNIDNKLLVDECNIASHLQFPSCLMILDIFYYDGINVNISNNIQNTFSQKSEFLFSYLNEINNNHYNDNYFLYITLPTFFPAPLPNTLSNTLLTLDIPYKIKHVQYFSSTSILPRYNVPIVSITDTSYQTTLPTLSKKKNNINRIFGIITNKKEYKIININKKIYQNPCIFWIKSTSMFDIYEIYAINDINKHYDNKKFIQYALINSYATSIMMTAIFKPSKRSSLKNKSKQEILDAIEDCEFDDNYIETQNNTQNKTILFECHFSTKFKRWIPYKPIFQSTININKIPTIKDL